MISRFIGGAFGSRGELSQATALIALASKRFAGFATLPVADPKASANELERTVKQMGFKGAMLNGIVHGEFLDDASFAPIFEGAEALGCRYICIPQRRAKQ